MPLYKVVPEEDAAKINERLLSRVSEADKPFVVLATKTVQGPGYEYSQNGMSYSRPMAERGPNPQLPLTEQREFKTEGHVTATSQYLPPEQDPTDPDAQAPAGMQTEDPDGAWNPEGMYNVTWNTWKADYGITLVPEAEKPIPFEFTAANTPVGATVDRKDHKGDPLYEVKNANNFEEYCRTPIKEPRGQFKGIGAGVDNFFWKL